MTTETQSGVQYTTLWYMKEVTGSWQAYQTIYAGSGSFSFVPPLGDGLYLFATVAADNLGNIEAGPTVSETQTIYDTNVPQSQVTWAPAYENSSPITMTWVATPTQPQVPLAEVRLWYRLNAGTWTQTSIVSTGSTTSGTFSFTPSGQGTHNFATVARDILGKSEANPSGAGDATTVYDTVAPTVAISSPTSGSVLTLTLTTFPVTGTAVDATSGITQVWVTTGTTWVPASGLSPWTYNWTLPIVDRVAYTLTARSTDNAANTGTSSSVSVIVDTVAPTAAAPTPNRSPWITSTVVYTWPASSDGAGIAGYRVLITNTLGYSSTLAASGHNARLCASVYRRRQLLCPSAGHRSVRQCRRLEHAGCCCHSRSDSADHHLSCDCRKLAIPVCCQPDALLYQHDAYIRPIHSHRSGWRHPVRAG